MATFLKLTKADDTSIIVNFDLVRQVTPSKSTTSKTIIFFEVGHAAEVKEPFEEIAKALSQLTSKKQ